MAGRHAAARRRSWIPLIIIALIAVIVICFAAGMISGRGQPAVTGHVTLASSTETPGQRILDKAETRTGDWYAWGAAGPSVFDCSGLVSWAAGQAGLRNWPRTTYEMLASPRLERIPLSSARRGDLMFYGTGHVEINTVWYRQTFGAQTWGTRVGWHRWGTWWQPSMAYRVLW